MQIERGSQQLEEYILSVCLNNKTALAKCVSHLSAERDFSGQGQKAFGILQATFQDKGEIDPLVILDKWNRLGIYDKPTSREIFSAYDGDTEFDSKIEELRKEGIFRKAQKDIYSLNEMLKKDIAPDKLTSQAMEIVSKWGLGSAKKYQTSQDVEQRASQDLTGKQLRQGIPLLDEKIYRNDGQRKGTVKATIFREKHGKTRHACWEAAQDLRMGYKVLYVTLEGQSADILGNIRSILKDEWSALKANLFHRDATTDVTEICGSIVEWCFMENGDKVIVDHMQRIEHPDPSIARSLNENGNKCCKMLTDLAVKYDLNMHLINQARQPEKFQRGYSQVPQTYDCYGSNQLIKDASIILVGFRPKVQDDLIVSNPLGAKVKGPDQNEYPINSVFLKPILSRKKNDYLHKWVHFVDSDEGYKISSQELI